MNLDDRFRKHSARGSSLHSCLTCGAEVHCDNRDDHNDWHNKLEEMLEKLDLARTTIQGTPGDEYHE